MYFGVWVELLYHYKALYVDLVKWYSFYPCPVSSVLFWVLVFKYRRPIRKVRWSAMLLNSRVVSFLWVPSHTGISGKELTARYTRESVGDTALTSCMNALSKYLKQYFRITIDETWNLILQSKPSKTVSIKTQLQPWSCTPTNCFHQVIITRSQLIHLNTYW